MTTRFDHMPKKKMLAHNLRYLRKRKGLSQEEVANMFGYKSFTTIQKWETGDAEPSLDKLRALADLFKVSLEDMMSKDLSNNVLYEFEIQHNLEDPSTALVSPFDLQMFSKSKVSDPLVVIARRNGDMTPAKKKKIVGMLSVAFEGKYLSKSRDWAFPKEPNITYARQLAIRAILSSEANSLPIVPTRIIEQLYGSRVEIAKYSEVANALGISIKEIEDNLGKEGLTQYLGEGHYRLIYNDTFSSQGRIRFTVAHEFAHIALEHFLLECDNPSELSEEQYNILEVEANQFAAELLAPTPIINHMLVRQQITSVNDIKLKFNISHQAAENRLLNITTSTEDLKNFKADELISKLLDNQV